MIEAILDDNFAFRNIEAIPDRVLGEIMLSQKKYPKKVIETVIQEIENRNLDLSNLELTNSELKGAKTSFLKWMMHNPKTSILVLFTAIFSGFAGSIIVLISVYSAIQEDNSFKTRIWRTVNILTAILITGTILLSFILF
ncbi:MAG: hypothetical protein ACKV1O_05140 [Saprospiraceae bacterium]